MRARRMKTRQQGVAVITALLLTTLAISIVASLFWQQQVQVRSMENQRLQLQTKWILRGALDWAGLVLKQDAMDNQRYTSLDQVWATPLAETRLDQYIERERVQGENYAATLSGSIIDATSRYNLSNLATNGQIDEVQMGVFQKLLSSLQMNPALARQTALFVAASQPHLPANPQGGGGGDQDGGGQPAVAKASTVMKLVQLEDLLAVPGFTPAMVDKLRPFAIVLPDKTKVNVNTAPAEVLAAVVPNYSVTQANSLVEQRKHAPWRDVPNFTAQVGGMENAEGLVDVHSDWFLVRSRILLDRATLNAEALVSRAAPDGVPSVIRTPQVKWIRQN